MNEMPVLPRARHYWFTYVRTWASRGLAQVLAEAGIPAEQARQRSEDAVIQIQAASVLTRGLDSTEPFERVLQQLPSKLLEPMS